MFGSPMPTKHTRRPASALAPAITSISGRDQPSLFTGAPPLGLPGPADGSPVAPVAHAAGGGRLRRQLLPARLAQPVDVLGVVARRVDPLVEPGPKPRGITADP